MFLLFFLFCFNFVVQSIVVIVVVIVVTVVYLGFGRVYFNFDLLIVRLSMNQVTTNSVQIKLEKYFMRQKRDGTNREKIAVQKEQKNVQSKFH